MAYKHPDPAEKAGYVQSKFDEIAADYDRFNDLITQGQHRWWKRVMVRRLAIRPEAAGLDLCCGTGDIAQRMRPLLNDKGLLVAADFSQNMLRIARKRLGTPEPTGAPSSKGKNQNPPVWLIGGDAMRLPFQNESFDFLTIGYGLRNVSDLDVCLAELLRVLKPGGVLASLDVGKVRNPVIRPFAEFYLFRIVPLIGRLLQPGQDMFTYLPNSTLDYPPQDILRGQLESAGFADVELIEFMFGASVIHLAHKPAR